VTYAAIFVLAAVNEALLALWTVAVASGHRGRAVAATIALEAVRLPALLLVAAAPLGSVEQVTRAAVATAGYALGVFLLLSRKKV